MKNPKVRQLHIAGDAFLVEFSYDGYDIHGEPATITNRAIVIDEDYYSLMDEVLEEWKTAGLADSIQQAAHNALQRKLDNGYEFSYPVFAMRSLNQTKRQENESYKTLHTSELNTGGNNASSPLGNSTPLIHPNTLGNIVAFMEAYAAHKEVDEHNIGKLITAAFNAAQHEGLLQRREGHKEPLDNPEAMHQKGHDFHIEE